jgi:predicted RNase H-like HicB family nuclease
MHEALGVPFIFVQQDAIEGAVANLKEATELYLEEFPLPETEGSFLTTFEATYIL